MNNRHNSTQPGPLMIDFAGAELDGEDRALLAHPAVGGAILFTRNYEHPEQLRALTDAMRACRPNLLITADYEGGRVQRFREGMTRIPPIRQLGRLWHDDRQQAVELILDTGWLMASELAALGVAMPLAPVLDIDYGQSSVIGDRAFAAEARDVAGMAQAFTTGLKQGGSAATAKHFPGHGHVAPDSHAELPVDDRPMQKLAGDMAPYQSLMMDGLASIMMAHICYPAVDDTWPASLSRRWIAGILRSELGFDGCVFCDDLSMGGAAEAGDYEQRAGLALAAGCDYLPVCNDREAVRALVESPALNEDAGPARRGHLHAACASAENAQSLEALQQKRRWRQTSHRLQTLYEQTE